MSLKFNANKDKNKMEENIWKGLDGRAVFSLSKEIIKGQTSEFKINLALNFIVKPNMRHPYTGRVIGVITKHRGMLCPKCV